MGHLLRGNSLFLPIFLQIDRKLGSIPLVTSVVKAVQGSMKVMLQSLLAQLRTEIQLPACLRVVGYLRRMDIFTETELR